MQFLVHVSVRIDGGLQLQTVVKIVWLLSGTHSQRKLYHRYLGKKYRTQSCPVTWNITLNMLICPLYNQQEVTLICYEWRSTRDVYTYMVNFLLCTLFPYSKLVSSDDHHRLYNINPSFNNYLIEKKYIYNSKSEKHKSS